MRHDIERILLNRAQIAARVEQLGRLVADDLDRLVDHPTRITLVPILTGSLIFLADLVRHLPHKLRIGVVSVSSYPGASVESKGALLRSAIPKNLAGRHVLIVDDILDSGHTLTLVESIIADQHPASLRKCVLLRKDCPRTHEIHVDYLGFDIPNVFVVGYGLDYDDYYRNLPDIGVLSNHAMTPRQPIRASESQSGR